jgi:hypothetical protein
LCGFTVIGESPQCERMTNFTELVPAPADLAASFTDQLRLAVAAYLARFKGSSRRCTESDLRCYLAWCTGYSLDPLAARRPHLVPGTGSSPAVYRRWHRYRNQAGRRMLQPREPVRGVEVAMVRLPGTRMTGKRADRRSVVTMEQKVTRIGLRGPPPGRRLPGDLVSEESV